MQQHNEKKLLKIIINLKTKALKQTSMASKHGQLYCLNATVRIVAYTHTCCLSRGWSGSCQCLFIFSFKLFFPYFFIQFSLHCKFIEIVFPQRFYSFSNLLIFKLWPFHCMLLTVTFIKISNSLKNYHILCVMFL